MSKTEASHDLRTPSQIKFEICEYARHIKSLLQELQHYIKTPWNDHICQVLYLKASEIEYQLGAPEKPDETINLFEVEPCIDREPEL